jgi:hypothetical protein
MNSSGWFQHYFLPGSFCSLFPPLWTPLSTSFQLEGPGSKIFVNVPGAKHIAVVDRMKRAVVGTWTVEEARENFSMVLDESGHHLFIGCRQPLKIIIYDTESGREVTKLDIPGDIDDIFYDGVNKRIYASCGEGFLSVFTIGKSPGLRHKSIYNNLYLSFC